MLKLNLYLQVGLLVFVVGLIAHAWAVAQHSGIEVGLNSLGVWLMALGVAWVIVWLVRWVIVRGDES